MSPFGTGGIDLVLSSQVRSRSAEHGECSPVIGNGTSDGDYMKKTVLFKAPFLSTKPEITFSRASIKYFVDSAYAPA